MNSSHFYLNYAGDRTSRHTNLLWMSESEKGIDVEKEANRICDKYLVSSEENAQSALSSHNVDCSIGNQTVRNLI